MHILLDKMGLDEMGINQPGNEATYKLNIIKLKGSEPKWANPKSY